MDLTVLRISDLIGHQVTQTGVFFFFFFFFEISPLSRFIPCPFVVPFSFLLSRINPIMLTRARLPPLRANDFRSKRIGLRFLHQSEQTSRDIGRLSFNCFQGPSTESGSQMCPCVSIYSHTSSTFWPPNLI
ncbi:hypothetical protein P170DRAFT_110761 [Aspergillus steynii IBT 23096]|uniref:Uncharacterized protein n=1 Tax=Aspergillus steynii IBT 23096 TaxID=1392250 RepID=A0A2I2GIN6_9EURO|nr:uncharacterized protein P170DRAFT_110761 [Aspergillus steynii IBT 23096]PLB52707.1 hypothetical protein P170DRAFT_110761 [Aspergillus steynii IBT 23096]